MNLIAYECNEGPDQPMHLQSDHGFLDGLQKHLRIVEIVKKPRRPCARPVHI